MKVVVNKGDELPNVRYVSKTVASTYGVLYNVSIEFIPFSLERLAFIDLILVDSVHYASLNPNPFVLTSVITFYSMGLIEPYVSKMEKSEFFTIPFDGVIWTILALFPIYFALALKIAERKSRILENMLAAIRVLAAGPINLESNSTLLRTVYFLTILFGLIMTMIYTSYLGCFLTRAVDKRDLDFMCTAPKIAILQRGGRYQDTKFMIFSDEEYFNKIMDTDPNYGYCEASVHWDKFAAVLKPLFRKVLPWEFSYGHYMRLNKSSKHQKTFNTYLINVHSSGLMQKWAKDDGLRRKFKKLEMILRFEDKPSILTFQDLKTPFKFYVYFLLISIVVFLAEICCEVVRNREFTGWLALLHNYMYKNTLV